MIPGPVHRSPDMYLKAEENPEKPQLRDHLMKGLCDQSSPQMGSLPPNEVSRIAQHVRKGEGRKEIKGGKRFILKAFIDLFWVHGIIGCGQKSLTLVWWCHQLLSGLLTKAHLPRVHVSHVGH